MNPGTRPTRSAPSAVALLAMVASSTPAPTPAVP